MSTSPVQGNHRPRPTVMILVRISVEAHLALASSAPEGTLSAGRIRRPDWHLARFRPCRSNRGSPPRVKSVGDLGERFLSACATSADVAGTCCADTTGIPKHRHAAARTAAKGQDRRERPRRDSRELRGPRCLRRHLSIGTANRQKSRNDQQQGTVDRMKANARGQSPFQRAMCQNILQRNLHHWNARKCGAPITWLAAKESQDWKRHDKPLKDSNPCAVIGPPFGVRHRGHSRNEELDQNSKGQKS